jgi:ZIP family zinc transporter
VGAAVAYLLLLLFAGDNTGIVSPRLTGITLGAVAGIMVYISVDELLPTSRAYGKGHDSLLGLVIGMAVMALSLLLLK